LFLLSMLLEYLRLSIRSFDAHLITSHHLTNGILSALGNNSTHRRKASIQQKRQSTQGAGSSGALLSSGVNTTTIGDRRVSQTDSNGSNWIASNDDSPLLPSPNTTRSSQKSTLFSRLQHAFV
jgi:hypothetical protein